MVETPDANLSEGMRQLNGVYTQRFNRRHALAGHLFQGRFKAIVVERDAYLLELARYVVLNPVRAGMVENASQWAWSSFHAMVGVTSVPSWLETDWILGQFGSERQQACDRYGAFVAEGTRQPSIWTNLRYQSFLGGEAFVTKSAVQGKVTAQLREVPRAQRRALEQPLAWFERNYPFRREAMAQDFRSGVYTMQEIADHFDVHYSTVSRAVRRFETDRP